jgi:hypothetical protein
MVITMSVMPPFTYPNLSLCSHRAIRVLCDLQMFPCPTNEEATCIHCAAVLETGTSSMPMTFGVALHCLEVSDAEVTLGTISHHVECPPPYSVQPQLRLSRGSTVQPTFSSKNDEGVPQAMLEHEGLSGLTYEGDAPARGTSAASSPHPQ